MHASVCTRVWEVTSLANHLDNGARLSLYACMGCDFDAVVRTGSPGNASVCTRVWGVTYARRWCCDMG